METEENRLCKKVYNNARNYAEQKKVKNWPMRIRDVLLICDLVQWWEDNSCGNLSRRECKKMLISILFRLEREKWQKEIEKKPKLRLYRLFKQEYAPEPYVTVVTSRAHRSLLAKLRGGSAMLEIETGRYTGLPAEQRLCKLCKSDVGDEAHFILTCPALQDSRRCLFDYMSLRTPNFPHLPVEEMLCAVMVEAGQSRRVSSLLHHMFRVRQSLLYI